MSTKDEEPRAGFSCTVRLKTWNKLVKAAAKRGVHWTRLVENLIEAEVAR